MIRTWDGVEFAGEQAAHDSYISMEKYIVEVLSGIPWSCILA